MAYQQAPKSKRHCRGFEKASGLLAAQIRQIGETRGFAVTRLLTHWREIAGDDIARVARPVEVSYGRGTFGATLTILASGAQAPMLEMRLPQLRDRVNACYGYAAISRIRITQTSRTGFAEAPAVFGHDALVSTEPSRKAERAARRAASGVDDDRLRDALERLGQNILSD